MKWNLQQIFRTSGSLWHVLFSLLLLLLSFTMLSCTNDINQQEINDDLAYRMAYYFNEFALLVSGNGTYSVNITDNTSTDLTGILIGNGSNIDASSNITSYVDFPTATTEQSGIIEIATTNETYTLTDNTRAISPYGLGQAINQSSYGKKFVQIILVADNESLSSGNGSAYFFIPLELNAWVLIDAQAMVVNPSSSSIPTYQIYNVTQAYEMLSTEITIDANENTSYTASTPPEIDTGNDDIYTGDIIRIDKDSNGTGELGDTILLIFGLGS